MKSIFNKNDIFRAFLLITVCLACTVGWLSGVRVFIDPPVYSVLSCTQFTLPVRVEGLTDSLRGYEMTVAFDSSRLIITDTSAFTEGDFLSNNGPTQWYVTGANGNYQVDCALLGVSNCPTGSGTLFSLTMTAKNQTTADLETDITLSNIIMRDVLNDPINADTVGGCHITIQPRELSIPLVYGWNLVSLPLEPLDTNISAVFGQLISSGFLLKVQDEQGRALVKDIQGNWINNIGNYQRTEGYYVKVNNPCYLNIYGCLTPLPLTIDLQQGWNIISYPYLVQQPAMTFIQPLIDADKLVKVQSETGAAIVKNTFGVWVNNIGDFQTGEGYYVNVNAPAQIVYPALGKAIDAAGDQPLPVHPQGLQK